MQKKKNTKLLEAHHAVESYLDNLLQEATEEPHSANTIKSQQQVKLSRTTDFDTQTEVKQKLAKVHVLETPLTAQLDVEVPSIATTEVKSEQSHDLQWPLHCLMFKVNGKLMSIPLIKMGNVVPWGGRLTQLPKSPAHVKGILKYHDHHIKVVDTALVLGDVIASDNDFSPSHLLVLEDYDWAISCNELLDVVTLEEKDIKWHDPALQKMTYGTIKESLAQLLNPTIMSEKLSNWEKL